MGIGKRVLENYKSVDRIREYALEDAVQGCLRF